MNLIPGTGPSAANMVKVFVFMGVIPGITFLSLLIFRDAIITNLLVSACCGGFAYAHYKYFEGSTLVWGSIIAKEGSTIKDDLKKALPMLAGAAVGILVLLGLYSYFISLGPKTLTLPFPNNGGIGNMIYWLFFFITFVLIVSLAEFVFFFVFCVAFWTQTWAKFLIVGVFAGYNFLWLIWVVPFIAALILTGLAFALGWVLLTIREKQGAASALAIRIGVGLGLFCYLIFLNFVYPGGIKSPVYYFRGNIKNIFQA